MLRRNLAGTGFEGPLAEFVALRQEVERRNVVQHALFVLRLTPSGAVFSFALSVRSHIGFLLIVPVSTCMLCARYVDQQIGSQRAAVTFCRDRQASAALR